MFLRRKYPPLFVTQEYTVKELAHGAEVLGKKHFTFLSLQLLF